MSDVGINDRRLALELHPLVRREIDAAIRNRLTAHRYGVVSGDPDTEAHTVAVQLYGLPEPSPGFVYGSGLAPRDGDHVRVLIDPKGDRWIDDVLGRDVVSEIVEVVTPPVVQIDRARGAIARVQVAHATVPTLTNWMSHADGGDTGASPEWNTGPPTLGSNFTATAGRLLVVVGPHRAGPVGATPAGWTRLGGEITSGNGLCGFAKDAAGGETGANFASGNWPVDWLVMELTGATVASISAVGAAHSPAASTWDSGSITPAAGIPAFIIGAIAGDNDTWLGTGVPQGAWIERGDFGQRGNGPHSYFMSQAIAATSGSYNPTVDVSASIGSPSHTWSGLTILISGIALDDTFELAPEIVDGDDATYF